MNQQLETPERPTTRPPNFGPTSAPPIPVPRRRKSNAELVHDGEDDGFLAQHRVKLIIAGVLALAVGVYFLPKPTPSAPARKVEKIVMIQLPPPPKLVPPPPPKVQPPPEKMEKQAPVADAKPKEAEKKADSPPAALTTGIKGNGPGVGLGDRGNGIGGGAAIGGKTGDGGGGGKWDRYAGQVQAKIAEALRKNGKTKAALISGLQVRIWPDATGRVSRAALAGSTGNSELDQVIEREILNGLQLAEAPPAGMKLPIVLRLSARRPN